MLHTVSNFLYKRMLKYSVGFNHWSGFIYYNIKQMDPIMFNCLLPDPFQDGFLPQHFLKTAAYWATSGFSTRFISPECSESTDFHLFQAITFLGHTGNSDPSFISFLHSTVFFTNFFLMPQNLFFEDPFLTFFFRSVHLLHPSLHLSSSQKSVYKWVPKW